MTRINLNSHHPILDVQNHVVFANNGNVALCYKVALPEIHSLSEQDFEELHSMWFQAFKSLPTGTVIHKQDIYQKVGYDAQQLPNNTFLEKATYEYFKGREYLSHHSYLFFVLPLDKTLNAAKYVNPFRKAEKGFHRKLDVQVAEFITAVNDAVSFINNGQRVSLSPMPSDDILTHTNNYYNGFNQDFDTNVMLNTKHIEIGDHFFDVIAVTSEKCFGESVQSSKTHEKFTSDDFTFHQGFIDGLGLELNENHIVNHILYLDDKHKWNKLLDKKVEELSKSSNFGSQNKVILKKIQHIQDQINHDDSSRIIQGHLNVIFWHSEAEHLKRIASQIKAGFKELDIVPYHPNGEERKHYFLNSHPCHATNFSNEDLYVTDLKHALCLHINNTNYTSDATGIIFNDRQNNIPVLKDVWDEGKHRIKARNFAIFAPTGEGKSFLANNILRQYFEQGVRLVLIDLGGSYAKFAKLYPDQHIILRYEQGKNLGINPFYMAADSDLTPERLEDLAVFLLELLAQHHASKSQEVAIKKVLLLYYKTIRQEHSLASLYQFVDDRKDTLLQDLQIKEAYFSTYDFLHILSEYVEDGPYSFLFNTGADQTYTLEDKRLIIFELDEVRDNKEILSVMLKLIKSAIQRTIWRNRSERGIILFDEFAKQLKFPNVLESVEFYYQAIRKQNGAIGIILQSINQLPQNSTSASILENTQVIYSLRNEKGYEALQKRLNLSSHDLNQLKSIRNQLSGERKYTEIFIKIGKESNVFRLEVPPEVYAAYLTDGTENTEIMNRYEETHDMEKAIIEFIQQKKKPL
ncbi:MAG: TraG family conjugative transposon ATPase [Muricauda sp.]|jgi:conjugation system TraG family ATPase|nr:TraG family conjugative transposon ATPase [Allomuricauda sp.]MBO6533308.1 TraG family conjugative transposon ATPase [Allomuricauda sp.]MBO6588579.1 TraG family conjugative transposon ATPase [Allomuricauda sp.]MBO6618282.1 TraG family conjugative transposon ATPase [Allomuricauda sp.]MBO6644117.1 TraG family conjugative transposon ATPase [Allomuricauda sp.]MBO6747001.1 TraG family conjugative transposon ATPase [Allomuricauda sp.]